MYTRQLSGGYSDSEDDESGNDSLPEFSSSEDEDLVKERILLLRKTYIRKQEKYYDGFHAL